MNDTQPKVKLTIAFDRDLHAATSELAHIHHRTFTGEVNHALERHVMSANNEEVEQ